MVFGSAFTVMIFVIVMRLVVALSMKAVFLYFIQKV